MKKFIIRKIEENIDAYRMDWAHQYYVMRYQEQFDTAESKKQVEAAKQNMLEIQAKIDFAEKLLKLEK